MFSSFTPRKGGFASYGDNNKGEIIGIGTVGKLLNTISREVILVYGLKLNLLSISQFCVKGNNVTFDSSGCMVIKSISNPIIFTSSRSGNTYTVNLNKFLQMMFVFLLTRMNHGCGI